MNDKEINDACIALAGWFESQRLSPADAGQIMIKMLAIQFFLKSRNDVVSLQRAINNTNDLLTIEIADMLRA